MGNDKKSKEIIQKMDEQSKKMIDGMNNQSRNILDGMKITNVKEFQKKGVQEFKSVGKEPTL